MVLTPFYLFFLFNRRNRDVREIIHIIQNLQRMEPPFGFYFNARLHKFFLRKSPFFQFVRMNFHAFLFDLLMNSFTLSLDGAEKFSSMVEVPNCGIR